jgi:hypothetical protein
VRNLLLFKVVRLHILGFSGEFNDFSESIMNLMNDSSESTLEFDLNSEQSALLQGFCLLSL